MRKLEGHRPIGFKVGGQAPLLTSVAIRISGSGPGDLVLQMIWKHPSDLIMMITFIWDCPLTSFVDVRSEITDSLQFFFKYKRLYKEH